MLFSRGFVMVFGDGRHFEVLRIFRRRIERKTGGDGDGGE